MTILLFVAVCFVIASAIIMASLTRPRISPTDEEVREPFHSPKKESPAPERILVLYVFHKMNPRVKHFLGKCIFDDPNIHFLVICNSKTLQFDAPEHAAVLKRGNIGYDFGGWTDGLHLNNNYRKYDKFLFINSSVMGPYLEKGEPLRNYVSRFTDRLYGDVKLFGATINAVWDIPTQAPSWSPLDSISASDSDTLDKYRTTKWRTCGYPHVQSYIFTMDRSTVQFLMNKGIFSPDHNADTFGDAIYEKEVLMSQHILENNWNIGCLLDCYKDIDFRFPDAVLDSGRAMYGDIMWGMFRDDIWTDQELVFVKGNRLKIKTCDLSHNPV